jgi:hypothetical protein
MGALFMLLHFFFMGIGARFQINFELVISQDNRCSFSGTHDDDFGIGGFG